MLSLEHELLERIEATCVCSLPSYPFGLHYYSLVLCRGNEAWEQGLFPASSLESLWSGVRLEFCLLPEGFVLGC